MNTYREMPHGCCQTLLFFLIFCFLNLLMDDNLSPWLQLTCLWVTLTLTEGGKGRWYTARHSNFITVMDGGILSSVPPPLFYSHGEWQITHLSLIV